MNDILKTGLLYKSDRGRNHIDIRELNKVYLKFRFKVDYINIKLFLIQFLGKTLNINCREYMVTQT